VKKAKGIGCQNPPNSMGVPSVGMIRINGGEAFLLQTHNRTQHNRGQGVQENFHTEFFREKAGRSDGKACHHYAGEV